MSSADNTLLHTHTHTSRRVILSSAPHTQTHARTHRTQKASSRLFAYYTNTAHSHARLCTHTRKQHSLNGSHEGLRPLCVRDAQITPVRHSCSTVAHATHALSSFHPAPIAGSVFEFCGLSVGFAFRVSLAGQAFFSGSFVHAPVRLSLWLWPCFVHWFYFRCVSVRQEIVAD